MAVRFALHLSPAGTPAKWHSVYVIAYEMRGALLPLLRETAGIDDLHGGRYVLFAAPDPEPDGNLLAYLSVGDDGRVEALGSGLAAIRDARIEIRAGGAALHLQSFEIETRVGSEALLAAPGVSSLDARFLTITTFASGNRRSRGIVDPALVIGSWASSWNGRAGGPAAGVETGEPCPAGVLTDLGSLLDPIRGTLTWGRAQLAESRAPRDSLRAPRSLYGFSGSLRLRLHHSADEVHARWLGRLAALAPFVGTGYHVQLGLGVTTVVAARPATAPAGRLEP